MATYGQLALLAGSPAGVADCRCRPGQGPGRAALPPGAVPGRLPVRQKAFGGPEIQRQLLEAEGVPFLPDGRVDVKVCLWETPEDA